MADSKHAVWGDIVRANAAAHRDKPALVCEDRALSFAQFEARTNRLDNALAALGLVKGDRVAILSRNRIEAVEAYGVAGAGLIALPLNWRLSARELLHPLQDGAPRALIAEPEFLPLIESLRPQLGGIGHFIAFDGARAGWLDYEGLLDNASAQSPRVEVRPGDVACLMYTSGTTGAPKGAMLTHGALARNARTAAEDLLHLTPEDVVLAVTPLFHVGGMWYHLFPSFAAGCSTVLMKDFEPRAVIDALQRHRASCVHLVPTMIHAVIEQPDAARLNFDHLRLMYYAASPIPPELLRRAMKVFSKSGFVQSYGSTEAGIVTGLTPEDHIEALREPRAAARLASCGRAVGKIGLRVVDSDGNTVAPGVIGEVQVKSDRSMVGYWNNAAATRAAMADGWFATGDLGRLDEDGYVTLVDRKHDMIVSGGENVYPVEVEAVLYRDPRILEAAVFGMPDPRWVEKVAAAIVLRPGAQATAEDIIARARTELAGYKCPKTVIFAERLPRNATGKVLKKELRRVYGAPPSMQANTERAELMSTTPNAASPGGENVKVEFEDGIAWVILNRPEKRNAMSPALNREMIGVLDALELDERCKVLVLTGAGESFSAGMDLKEYFRETDQASPIEVMRVRRDSMGWQWRRLMYFPKPTIAMVNGWCFGGAFTPLVACDLALAAHEATFGLSEINWGIIPAGNVMRAVAEKMNSSDALYYLMTGDPFDGRKAAATRLVLESVPRAELRDRTRALAKKLMEKNAHVQRAIKLAYRRVKEMNWDVAEDYLYAKAGDTYASDPERGRAQGMDQFLDKKSFRPGLETYKREDG